MVSVLKKFVKPPGALKSSSFKHDLLVDRLGGIWDGETVAICYFLSQWVLLCKVELLINEISSKTLVPKEVHYFSLCGAESIRLCRVAISSVCCIVGGRFDARVDTNAHKLIDIREWATLQPEVTTIKALHLRRELLSPLSSASSSKFQIPNSKKCWNYKVAPGK